MSKAMRKTGGWRFLPAVLAGALAGCMGGTSGCEEIPGANLGTTYSDSLARMGWSLHLKTKSGDSLVFALDSSGRNAQRLLVGNFADRKILAEIRAGALLVARDSLLVRTGKINNLSFWKGDSDISCERTTLLRDSAGVFVARFCSETAYCL